MELPRERNAMEDDLSLPHKLPELRKEEQKTS